MWGLLDDQSARDIGRAELQPRRRRIVRKTAGSNECDAHILVGQKCADGFTKGTDATE